jgi:cell division protein FtsA
LRINRFDVAEKLKVNYGHCIPDMVSESDFAALPLGNGSKHEVTVSFPTLAGIIGARMEEIISLIHEEILSTDYHHCLTTGAGIVVTGGVSKTKGLVDLFKIMTGAEVRIGSPTQNISGKTPEIIKHPEYATVVGMALSNFMPYDSRITEFKESSETIEKKLKLNHGNAIVKEQPVISNAKPVAESEAAEDKGGKSMFGLSAIKEFAANIIAPPKN